MLCPEEAAIINGFHGVPPQEKPEGWRSLGAVNRWLGWTLTTLQPIRSFILALS